MESLEEQVEAKLVTSGSISIVAQAQQMKLPYSLLKSVKSHLKKPNYFVELLIN